MLEEKKIIVSDEFFDIFKNLNVISQLDKMKNLSTKELYLLLVAALDKHDDSDNTVIFNISEFKKEVMDIYHIHDDKISDIPYILKLIEETGDKYIETDNIINSNGDKLPNPLSKDEVRDSRINNIFE